MFETRFPVRGGGLSSGGQAGSGGAKRRRLHLTPRSHKSRAMIRHDPARHEARTCTHPPKREADSGSNTLSRWTTQVAETGATYFISLKKNLKRAQNQRVGWESRGRHILRQNFPREEEETMPEVVAPGKAWFRPDDDAYVRL
ncbi:MAG: hypothetical protein LC102_11660 [Ignavibacteriales bacterium]|nr:hypothetical protein [Ignavibacteriales bacterium]